MAQFALTLAADGTLARVPYRKSTSYKTISTAVGGFIERIAVSDEFALYLNEEGKLSGLPLNIPATVFALSHEAIFPWDVIVGDVAIISAKIDREGYEYGLTEDQCTRLESLLRGLVD